MKRNLRFKVIFGISALSLVSGFNVFGVGTHFEEKRTNIQIFYEKDKGEGPKKINATKSKQILPRIKKILKSVPKLIVTYFLSAVLGLFTLYAIDTIPLKLFNVKGTEYIRDFFE